MKNRTNILLTAIVVVVTVFSTNVMGDIMAFDTVLPDLSGGSFSAFVGKTSLDVSPTAFISKSWGYLDKDSNVQGDTFDIFTLSYRDTAWPGWDQNTTFPVGYHVDSWFTLGLGPHNLVDPVHSALLGYANQNPVVTTRREGGWQFDTVVAYARSVTDQSTYYKVLIDGQPTAQFTGSAVFERDYYITDQSTVVPIPGAILLGIVGLSMAGVKLRKFA